MFRTAISWAKRKKARFLARYRKGGWRNLLDTRGGYRHPKGTHIVLDFIRRETAMEKLVNLRFKLSCFKEFCKVLSKIKSHNLEKALTFLDDKMLEATSNSAERVNRRHRKMQKSIGAYFFLLLFVPGIIFSAYNNFKLSGIIGSGNNKKAVIAGERYEEGEDINGYKILEINTGHILVEKKSKTYKVNVGEYIHKEIKHKTESPADKSTPVRQKYSPEQKKLHDATRIYFKFCEAVINENIELAKRYMLTKNVKEMEGYTKEEVLNSMKMFAKMFAMDDSQVTEAQDTGNEMILTVTGTKSLLEMEMPGYKEETKNQVRMELENGMWKIAGFISKSNYVSE